MEVLPNEILCYVGDYLSYVETQAWRRSCRFIRENLPSPDINVLLKKELSKHIEKVDKFLELLYKKKAVLAGSFMVKVLYDAEWVPGDIDVFESFLKGSSLAASEGVAKEDCNRYNVHQCLPLLGLEEDPGCRYRTGTEECKTINYIKPLYKMSPMRRIYETFDNDIVKIAYFQGKLYVKDWQKLFVKKSYSVPSYVMWIKDYGDIFPNDRLPHIEEMIRIALETMQSRKEKYEERGFTVVQHPESLHLIKKGIEYCLEVELEKDYAQLFSLLDFNKYLDQELV